MCVCAHLCVHVFCGMCICVCAAVPALLGVLSNLAKGIPLAFTVMLHIKGFCVRNVPAGTRHCQLGRDQCFSDTEKTGPCEIQWAIFKLLKSKTV